MKKAKKLKKKIAELEGRLAGAMLASVESQRPPLRVVPPVARFAAAAATSLDDVEKKITSVRDWTDSEIKACDPQNVGYLGQLQEMQRLMGEALLTVDRLRGDSPRRMPAPTLIPQQTGAHALTPAQAAVADRMGWDKARIQAQMEASVPAARATAGGTVYISPYRTTAADPVEARVADSIRRAAEVERAVAAGVYLPWIEMPEPMRDVARRMGWSAETVEKTLAKMRESGQLAH